MSVTDKVPPQLIYQISWFLAFVSIILTGIIIYAPGLFSNQLLVLSPVILLLIAELATYFMWQLYIPASDYIRLLQRSGQFLMAYAVIQAISSSELLRLVVAIAALVSWSRLYTETGGFSFIELIINENADPKYRITFLIFIRLLVGPVIGVIYLFGRQVNPDIMNEVELITAFSAFVLAFLIRYCLQFDQEVTVDRI